MVSVEDCGGQIILTISRVWPLSPFRLFKSRASHHPSPSRPLSAPPPCRLSRVLALRSTDWRTRVGGLALGYITHYYFVPYLVALAAG